MDRAAKRAADAPPGHPPARRQSPLQAETEVKLTAYKNKLLLGLYDFAKGRTGLQGRADVADAAAVAGLDKNDMKLLPAVELLRNEGLIEARIRQHDTGIAGAIIWLTAEGLLAIEELQDEAADDDASVPAADRYVTRADNQSSFDQLAQAVGDLTDELRKINDRTPELDAAEIELRCFQLAIESPLVNVHLADKALKSAAVWICGAAVGAIIGAVAVRAFDVLLNLWEPLAASLLAA